MSRGFAVAANVKAEVIAAAAREAEATGYTSFWVNHPGPFDGLASVAVAAKATQRIALGIGVIPLHTRGPASIVEGARTHALPLDRLSPEHAKASAALVREGAQAAKRPAPRMFGYVRLAMGPGAADRVAKEGGRYAAIPAYKANFDRMGVKPEATAIVADSPAEVTRALARWEGVIDEIILRALPADDGVDATLALVRAAKPSGSRA